MRSAVRSNIFCLLIGFFIGAILIALPLWRMYLSWHENRFDELILRAAGENGCDPSLIKAVVWRESKFDPSIRGKQGEIGLMQVMPMVADEWSETRGQKKLDATELANPAINLRVGSWYLSKALQQWSQASTPTPIALAQYNAGRSNVLKWIDANSLADEEYFVTRIGFPSTRAYVKDILRQYRSYRQRGEF